jgi:hypothetical protein
LNLSWGTSENPLQARFAEFLTDEVRRIHLLRMQAMYACIPEIGCGFFEGACTPSNATANSYGPPPPRNAKGPVSHWRGSGPMWITSRSAVGGALVWDRGKPSLAHCQSTAHKPPTHHAQCRRHVPQSIAGSCAPCRNPLLEQPPLRHQLVYVMVEAVVNAVDVS